MHISHDLYSHFKIYGKGLSKWAFNKLETEDKTHTLKTHPTGKFVVVAHKDGHALLSICVTVINEETGW